MTRQASIQVVTRSLGLLIAVTFTGAVSGQSPVQPSATSAPVQAGATGQQGAPALPAGSPDISIIAAPQIPDEAMQLDQRLRTLPDRMVPEAVLSETEREINQLRETIREAAREAEASIQSGAILTELQQSLLDWQSLSERVTDLADSLTGQAISLEAEVRSLRDIQTRWVRTYDQIKAEKSPPKLLELTRDAVTEIRAAVKLVEKQRARVAALQESVAAHASIVSVEIENLRKAVAQLQRSLLERDSPRLWKAQFSQETDETLARSLRKSYASDFTRLVDFLRARKAALSGIGLLTVAAFALFVRLGKRAKTSSVDATSSADPVNVFHRPASVALLVGVVASMPLLSDAPVSARGLAYLLAVVPVVRLLMPRLPSPIRILPVVLIGSVVTWQLISFLSVPLWIKRDLLAVFCLAVVATFWHLGRALRRDPVQHQRAPAATLAAIWVGLALIVTALLANILGYFRFSDLLTRGNLVSAYRAVALYTVFVVGNLIISYTLQAETSRRLAIPRTAADRLARQLSFALGLVVFLVWLHSCLNLFAVRETFYGAIETALKYQITIGSATFDFSHIVAFALTLFFGYLIAALIRAILGGLILPRLKLARGLPNAIATITHYVVLVLIFMLALAAGGVELSKFAILTGAIGVGLGFGLQNVVNNFVSGLILLFERPIRVGDVLEVGGVSGEVTKIGFRSSTLQCFDGSALIIPNANLISQQVINWTLTGTRRQILIKIQVAHGNDPTRVRDLLLETVSAQPDVLEFPKPTVLFLGFEASALNFEVRFWAPRPEIVPDLKSNTALSIATALSEAGVKVAIPQHDLYIQSTDKPTTEVALSPRRTEGEEVKAQPVRFRNQKGEPS